MIADALVRGENLSRKYPIIIAVSKSDVANIDDFMKEEEAAVATTVPIVRWQEGVTAVMVLAGQHRIMSARAAVSKMANELTSVEGRLPAARELHKAKLAEADKALQDKKMSTKKKDAKKDAADAAQADLMWTKSRAVELRNRIDETRFWPAIFYDKGEYGFL